MYSFFFHSRLENCQGKLHCYVRGGIAHNKKLECIRANRLLSLQSSPITGKTNYNLNNYIFKQLFSYSCCACLILNFCFGQRKFLLSSKTFLDHS